MSSILKALKKLEEEAPRYGDSQPYPVDVKNTVGNQVTKKQKYYKFLLILFSAIIIVSASVFLLTRQNVSRGKESPDEVMVVRKAIPARPKKENVKIASVPDFKSRKKRAKLPDKIKAYKDVNTENYVFAFTNEDAKAKLQDIAEYIYRIKVLFEKDPELKNYHRNNSDFVNYCQMNNISLTFC